MSFTVEFKGPFFDSAEWDSYMRDFMEDMTMDVADQGTRELRTAMFATFKVPTGRYERTVKASPLSFGSSKIDGEGTVYAWWLEGIGSRNFPVTVFKGYHLFEKETAKLNRGILKYVESDLRRFIDRVNA
jgi:hypothetical protein